MNTKKELEEIYFILCTARTQTQKELTREIAKRKIKQLIKGIK